MAAGYGPTAEEISAQDDGGCLLEFPRGNCIATRNQAFNNAAAAAVAGTVAGVIGTVVSLAIVIPLSPLLGTSVGL